MRTHADRSKDECVPEFLLSIEVLGENSHHGSGLTRARVVEQRKIFHIARAMLKILIFSEESVIEVIH